MRILKIVEVTTVALAKPKSSPQSRKMNATRFVKERIRFCSWLVLLCTSLTFLVAQGQDPARVAGHVRDEAGAVVAGAQVELQSRSGVLHTISSDDGAFGFYVPGSAGLLIIRAPGFALFSRKLDQSSETNLEVVLSPASLRDQVTVTATRTGAPLAATAASVRLLSSSELSTSAALTLDDVLRQVPGFQLFRRTGSRTANPTSQGVSLRGVGASGASRALVLVDGIPFADPFGGWVYWDRIPRVAVSQVEVVRGGSSDLYGSSAMGGVINILTRESDQPAVSFETSYGNEDSPIAALFAGAQYKNFMTSLGAELFHTDGYINVREADRGVADTPVASRHRSIYLDVGYNPSQSSHLFLRPSYFAENRANGTPLQTNQTRIAEIDGGGDWSLHQIGEFSLRGYLSAQTYDQSFSAIATNRNSETLTRLQRVPAQAAGWMFQWSRVAGSRQSLVAGVEGREVRGASDEIIFDRGRASSLVGAGGRQGSYAFFVRDTIRLTSKLSVAVGARADHFKNFAASSVTRVNASSDQVIRFADRTELMFSPQTSILYNANDRLSVFGSFYRAFRSPTLNELYRSFRLGNVLTLANENLRREQATGGEAGARITLMKDRFDLRASFFATTVTDPIANVTLAVSPALITRQRENLGRTCSRGLELESSMRLNRGWNLTAGYLFVDARVIRFPANVSIEGLAIPQTPRQSFTFQLNHASSREYQFGLQGRFGGSQFEDDQNLLVLHRFFTVDAYLSRFVSRKLEVYVAGENVFGSRYELGRTPVVTVAPPALLRVGLKLNYRRSH